MDSNKSDPFFQRDEYIKYNGFVYKVLSYHKTEKKYELECKGKINSTEEQGRYKLEKKNIVGLTGCSDLPQTVSKESLEEGDLSLQRNKLNTEIIDLTYKIDKLKNPPIGNNRETKKSENRKDKIEALLRQIDSIKNKLEGLPNPPEPGEKGASAKKLDLKILNMLFPKVDPQSGGSIKSKNKKNKQKTRNKNSRSKNKKRKSQKNTKKTKKT